MVRLTPIGKYNFFGNVGKKARSKQMLKHIGVTILIILYTLAMIGQIIPPNNGEITFTGKLLAVTVCTYTALKFGRWVFYGDTP